MKVVIFLSILQVILVNFCLATTVHELHIPEERLYIEPSEFEKYKIKVERDKIPGYSRILIEVPETTAFGSFITAGAEYYVGETPAARVGLTAAMKSNDEGRTIHSRELSLVVNEAIIDNVRVEVVYSKIRYQLSLELKKIAGN